MRKQISTFALAFVSAAALLSFASSSEAAAVKLRKISRLTAPQEATTLHIIQTVKAKIESDCRVLSDNGQADRVEFMSEKVVGLYRDGGKLVVTGKPACDNEDLPCSRVPSRVEGGTMFRDLDLVVARKFEGQRYYIKVDAHWDLDLPAPRLEVRLDSKYCR